MIGPERDADVERFRRAVTRCLGLQFEDASTGLLVKVLRRRSAANQQDPQDYVRRLETEPTAGEIAALARELTIPETYFFRNRNHYRVFTEVALPDRFASRKADKRLRILSAGCASGEEPYSLAILVRETADPSCDVSIRAVDVNPEMLARARRARYSAWSLRDTPAHVRQRWFTPVGREFRLDGLIRSDVTFEVRNLAQDDPQLWPPDTYDVVFFRNVFMYFTHQVAQAAIARIAGALRPGGYLFLGAAETLRGFSSDFHLRHTHGTFYYQRMQRLAARSLSPTLAAAQEWIPAEAVAVVAGDTWIDAIQRATDRVAALTVKAQPVSGRHGPLVVSALEPDHLEPTGTVRQDDRTTEELEPLQRLPAEAASEPDTLLVEAALLTHRGCTTEAEETCRRLLVVDESPEAHYLLALCRESERDNTGAMHHDQIAIHLDPCFAMPHLHLGLLKRRAGDRAAARHLLGRALTLLQYEDTSRLLRLGDGFGREMLVEMCRTELAACGALS